MATNEHLPLHKLAATQPLPPMTMAPDFIVADPPQWIAFDIQSVEADPINGEWQRFSHFRWRDADHWLMGRMVWRNRLASGFGLVRPRGGHRIYRAPLMVRPEYRPVEFHLYRPLAARRVRTSHFTFVGFDPATSVDMAFVRAEHKRLVDLPTTFEAEDVMPMPRPPSGHIV